MSLREVKGGNHELRSRVISLLKVLFVKTNHAVAQKQLADLETKVDEITFREPTGALDAVGQITAIQQQADQIYCQQQLNHLIEQFVATPRK